MTTSLRVAVTGASGFLGSYVLESLRDAGHVPVALIRNARWTDDVKALGAQDVGLADLQDRASMAAAMKGCDAVILVAALAVRHDPPWEEWLHTNVTGTENAVLAAHDAGIRRVVHVSTVAVHRVLAPWKTITLDTPLLDEVRVPVSVHFVGTRRKYSISKAMGETRARVLCKLHGMDLTVLRPGPVYGGRDPKTTSRYRDLLDRRLVALPTTPVPHVHARDVADACVSALAAPRSIGRDYFVTGEAVSLVDIIRTLRELAGRGPRVVAIPAPAGIRYDDGPAVRDLGFRTRSLRDGLTEVLSVKPRA